MVSTFKVDWSPKVFKQVSNSRYIHGSGRTGYENKNRFSGL